VDLLEAAHADPAALIGLSCAPALVALAAKFGSALINPKPKEKPMSPPLPHASSGYTRGAA